MDHQTILWIIVGVFWCILLIAAAIAKIWDVTHPMEPESPEEEAEWEALYEKAREAQKVLDKIKKEDKCSDLITYL